MSVIGLLEELEKRALLEQSGAYSKDELTPVIINPPGGKPPKGGLPPQNGQEQITVEVISVGEEEGEGEGEGEGESVSKEEKKTNKPGKPGEPGKSGKPKTDFPNTLDSHDVLAKSDKREAKEMAEKILEAAEETRKKRGEGSEQRGTTSEGSFIDKLRKSHESKVDWAKELKRKITEFKTKTASTVNKLSRKTAEKYKEGMGRVKSKAYHQWLKDPRSHEPSSKILYKGPYVKAPVGEVVLIIALDTSGSIPADTVSKVFAEMDSIAKSFKTGISYGGSKLQGRVYFMSWDTEVRQADEYKPGEWKKYSEGEKNVKGGGGTTVGSIFRYLEDHMLFEPEKSKVATLNLTKKLSEPGKDKNNIKILMKEDGGDYKAEISPYLIIATDGYHEKPTDSDLGKLYKDNKDNVLYLVIDGTTANCYPENIIEYESYRI